MSDSVLRAKPSMELPSKLSPSENAASSSLGVMAKDFICPMTSVNHMRMKWM